MEMQASTALDLTMVARLGHPHLTLLCLTLLLRLIPMMMKIMKEAEKKNTTMSEASRRHP
jgi:hypothetical protein